MKKYLSLLFLGILLLTACTPFFPTDEELPDDEKPVSDADDTETSTVDFLDTPEEMLFTDIVSAHESDYLENIPEWWTENDTAYLEYVSNLGHKMWKTGIVSSGDYVGQSLILATIYPDEMGPINFARFVVDEDADEWTLLEDYSSVDMEMMNRIVPFVKGVEDLLTIDAFAKLPDELDVYTSAKVVLTEQFDSVFYDVSSVYIFTEQTNIQDTSFEHYYVRSHKDDSGEQANTYLYAESPDGVLSRYIIIPSVFAADILEEKTTSNHTFVDLDGERSEENEYTIFGGGCGGYSLLGTALPSSEEEGLIEKVGTLDGEDVYTLGTIGEQPEDFGNTMLDALYLGYNSYVSRVTYAESPEEPVSIQDFVDDNNLFFLKMDNGVYIMVFMSAYAPVAECGKPVIYLYPEKTRVVNVRVGIDTFTKTEPKIQKNGWTVLAQPNGVLRNLVDGLTYPYLFWEGQSDENFVLDEGFTLEKNGLASRLPGVLQSMGLNERETADFMEFWLPKLMQVKEPYLEFTFVGNEVMDTIAPLIIYPKPDQVLRVFMYYKGVNTSGMDVPAYIPVLRHGFTVVEWGGTLY